MNSKARSRARVLSIDTNRRHTTRSSSGAAEGERYHQRPARRGIPRQCGPVRALWFAYLQPVGM